MTHMCQRLCYDEIFEQYGEKYPDLDKNTPIEDLPTEIVEELINAVG